jgi:hypothetical protein
MNKDELLFWLQNLVITGREEGDDEGEDNQDGDEGDEGDEGNNDDGSGDGDGDNDEPVTKADLEKVQKALKEERRLRREAQKALRQKQKDTKDEADSANDAEAQKKIRDAETKAEKLAARLRRREVDSAILEAARAVGFIDPTDALTDSIREAVDVDQDEDDPSDIDVDLDSVKDAVKDLAAKKKHLVGQGTPGEPSGGKFRKGKKKGDEDAGILAHYPSLNN